MKKRRSILFYFDNFHLVSSLPDEQLGLLFRALMEFGEQEVNNGGASLSDFPRRYPAMGEMTRACFAFMADTIRRDAAAYNEKCANYRAAAEKRKSEKSPARENRIAAQGLDPAWNYVT